MDLLKVLVVGRRASIFRLEYEETSRSRNFGNFEKLAMVAALLINTPRLSKDKRTFDGLGKERSSMSVFVEVRRINCSTTQTCMDKQDAVQ